MAERIVNLKEDEDVLVIKREKGGAAAPDSRAAASAVPPVGRGDSKVPDWVQRQGEGAVKGLLKRLNDARNARLAAVSLEEAGFGGLATPEPLLWDLATYGPIQFAPGIGGPSNPNKVIQEGHWAGIVGISVAGNAVTAAHLAGKDFIGRFSFLNVTNATSGLAPGTVADLSPFPPSTHVYDSAGALLVPLNRFSADPFHMFVFYFQPALSVGSEADLYDVNFTIDISFPGAPGAGFANWHYDPDSATGITGPITIPGVRDPVLPSTTLPTVPPTAAMWRNAISGRFMVNRFPA